MSLIELNGVEKSYQMGEMLVQALKGVDLSIREQEFMAVVGPSGSGKSTLLNLIGTIDEPTAGSVSLKGQDVNKLKDNERTELRNRTIGFVFQRFNLVPVLTALENVSLPLELQGIKAAEARKRALAALEEVGLAAQVRHRPDQLSGGQQQRVAIARALVTNPSLVIADEPTANLDSDTSQKIIELMRNLNTRHKTTFIFSTHDQRLLGHVDRLVHLQDGRIISAPGAHS
ncbi:ABC transporter ATP-binding protein [Corallococcus sp. ZKHCc1 1396]|uniref:ABC transporter ATP-binding protein n=1 Tax=Corallococcus soli TaxID=2710757 RepID=A0ABR9PV96_9BACT|nr:MULTISPECIES: ABC transporter ATP-binding protein [Corallococcus]MBE4751863.1 ABC transporter ATP-binding protein [Corallococcus soli]MCY1034572.1 ABC transporter ATP-binding protein [Corallococcus sp. BB11-1]